MNIIDGTTNFHYGAELPTATWFEAPSRSWSEMQDLRDLRVNLLKEEFEEYLDGEENNDIVETVDGLLDVIVIAWGTLLAYVGENKATRAAEEVVRSNLSKVDGSLGPIIRRADGKLLKPEGWMPPNIEGALSNG